MLGRLVLINRGSRRDEWPQSFLHDDFDVLTFPSVEKAVEGVKDAQPHAVLAVDDGRLCEVLHELRLRDATRDLPIIAVSGNPSPILEAAAFQAGADDFLSKTSDPAVIKARLAGVLRHAYSVKRLRAKLEEMDSFVRTVSHDLKNPLGSILSSAELLLVCLNSGKESDVRELAGNINRASEHALEFIEDLLNLLRHGSPLRDVTEVSAAELIDASLKELERTIRETRAIIEVPPNLPTITCDRRRMVQVFTNIFSNALKYVDKGVRPHISLNLIETPHASTFVITDNGIGMDPKDTKKIFQSFVRLPEAAEYTGTGLGLSIVQRIVEAHEGEVFARSRKGMGSEFYIVLPTKLSFVHALEMA